MMLGTVPLNLAWILLDSQLSDLMDLSIFEPTGGAHDPIRQPLSKLRQGDEMLNRHKHKFPDPVSDSTGG